jgi:sulfate transport system ATP-binding protein
MKQLHAAQAITTLYVTHNQNEALELGQRIAVMCNGQIQQIGSRDAILQQPASEWVAGFFSHLKQRAV